MTSMVAIFNSLVCFMDCDCDYYNSYRSGTSYGMSASTIGVALATAISAAIVAATTTSRSIVARDSLGMKIGARISRRLVIVRPPTALMADREVPSPRMRMPPSGRTKRHPLPSPTALIGRTFLLQKSYDPPPHARSRAGSGPSPHPSHPRPFSKICLASAKDVFVARNEEALLVDRPRICPRICPRIRPASALDRPHIGPGSRSRSAPDRPQIGLGSTPDRPRTGV